MSYDGWKTREPREDDEPTMSDEDLERILDAFAGMTMQERIDTLPRFKPDWTLEKDGPPVDMFKSDDGEWVRRSDVEMMLDRELRADGLKMPDKIFPPGEPPAAAQMTRKDDLAWRLGCMAEAVLSAKVGPQAIFFTRQTVDEIVMLLHEAEKRIVEGR